MDIKKIISAFRDLNNAATNYLKKATDIAEQENKIAALSNYDFVFCFRPVAKELSERMQIPYFQFLLKAEEMLLQGIGIPEVLGFFDSILAEEKEKPNLPQILQKKFNFKEQAGAPRVDLNKQIAFFEEINAKAFLGAVNGSQAMKEFYESNADFREYVNRYCNCYDLSVEEALLHALVKEVARQIKQGAAISK